MSDQFREAVLSAGRQMQDRDLTVETWGNISVRDPASGRIYLTPSGMDYSTLKPEDICVLDPEGNILEGNRKPSVEKMLHVLVYQKRKDVNAILHTHPVSSTVFAVLHEGIPVVTDEMAQAIGGPVRCAAYGLPGSEELAHSTAEALGDVQACLMANHGALCVGKDMKECFKVATVLETAADIYTKARAIGKPVEISAENTAWMRDFALHHYGQKQRG
jgi:L-fuculose-phosphate aldolase